MLEARRSTGAPQETTLGDPSGREIGAAGREMIERLRTALTELPQVRFAALFGSWARGTASPASDIDIAVLAPGIDLLELTSRLSEVCEREVDVVSVEDPGIPLLEELIGDARLLYQAVPGAYAAWRSRALTLLELDRPLYGRMRDAWLKRVARDGL